MWSGYHDTDAFSNLLYAVHTARKGGARRSDVLNTLGAEAFVQALRARRRS